MTERELLEKFKRAKEQKDIAEENYEAAKDDYNKAEWALMQHMEDYEKTKTATYDGLGYAIIPKPRLYANCSEENKEELFDYLEKIKRTDLIKTDVNAQTLSAFVREQLELGTEIPKFINCYFKKSVQLK